MSLGACIPGMMERGELTAAQGARMAELFQRLERHYRATMGEAAAAAEASVKTLEALEAEHALRKRQTLLQITAQQKAMEAIRGFDGGGAVLNPRGAIALLVRDDKAPYANVEYRWRNIRGQAHALIDGILTRHRTNLLGQVRNRTELADIVRELFGTDTGSLAAREMADAWRRAGEMLRQRFNAAGGDIGKLEGWGLPQSHDSAKVDAAGLAEWKAFVTPRLDMARMIDSETGLPFTPDRLGEALDGVWNTIRTEGWSKRAPGGVGAGKLANRHAEHRFLHFRDAESWMAYNDQFGGADAFSAMMSHIDMMSRDIALMEILGPNPAATVKWLQDNIEKSAAVTGDRKDRRRAFSAERKIQGIFDELLGKHQRPENHGLALGMSTLRSWQTASKLGSAVLSTTSDVATSALTRNFNGIPAMQTFNRYAQLLSPTNTADRSQAIRLGLIAEEYSNQAAAQGRFLGEELTGEVSRRVAEGVLRVSGLNAVTQAGRWGIGMDFLAHIAHERAKDFADLDPAFRGFFTRYGIDAQGWDAIRSTPLKSERGADWLTPDAIADRAIADRLMEGILSETDFAVPVAGLELRAGINRHARKGTWLGELVRTGFQFKAFPIAIMVMQSRRSLALGAVAAVPYAAKFLILTTVAGAAAIQLKEISKGRDPKPMTDWEFWAAAALQGGGLGIYGDFITSATSRFGGSVLDTLKGPAWQTVDNAVKLTVGDAAARARGSEPNTGGKLVNFLRQETPGGSLWFIRAAFERILLDELQEQIDPDYRKYFRRIEKRAEEQDTGYYWRPGQRAPMRAPDMQNALAIDGPR